MKPGLLVFGNIYLISLTENRRESKSGVLPNRPAIRRTEQNQIDWITGNMPELTQLTQVGTVSNRRVTVSFVGV